MVHSNDSKLLAAFKVLLFLVLAVSSRCELPCLSAMYVQKNSRNTNSKLDCTEDCSYISPPGSPVKNHIVKASCYDY